MENLVKNIVSLRRQKQLSQQQLADAFGIKRSTLSAYEQGKAVPPITVLQQYAKYFHTSINSLLGEEITSPATEKLPLAKVLAITVDKENNENIEFVPEKASAGYLSSYGDPVYIKELPKFRLPFLKNGTFRAFEIKGDSMLPVPSGSIIVGQYVETIKELKTGETYIFVTAWHGILFKRIAFIGADKLLLSSDNPLYHSYDLPFSEINEVWRTRLYISDQLPEPADKTLDRLQNAVTQLHSEIQHLRSAKSELKHN